MSVLTRVISFLGLVKALRYSLKVGVLIGFGMLLFCVALRIAFVQ